jgi:hypothetical protein
MQRKQKETGTACSIDSIIAQSKGTRVLSTPALVRTAGITFCKRSTGRYSQISATIRAAGRQPGQLTGRHIGSPLLVSPSRPCPPGISAHAGRPSPFWHSVACSPALERRRAQTGPRSMMDHAPPFRGTRPDPSPIVAGEAPASFRSTRPRLDRGAAYSVSKSSADQAWSQASRSAVPRRHNDTLHSSTLFVRRP